MSPVWQVDLSDEFIRQAEDITSQLRAGLVAAFPTRVGESAPSLDVARRKLREHFTLREAEFNAGRMAAVGGRIACESAVGEGTTFVVTVPRVPGPAQAVPVAF